MRTIFDKGLQFLAKRDYSERELIQKLMLYFPEQDSEILEAIEKLKASSYLDNERFLESRVRHRLQQGYGQIKILAELSQLHGFSKAEVLNHLREEPQAQNSSLGSLIAKKFPHYQEMDFKEKNKAIQFCLRRGFTLDQIKRLLAQ